MKGRLCLYFMIGAITLVGCTAESTPDVSGSTPTDISVTIAASDVLAPADNLATLRAEVIVTRDAQPTSTPRIVPTIASATLRPTEIPVPNGQPVLPLFDDELVGLAFRVLSLPNDPRFINIWQVTPDGTVELIWDVIPSGSISQNGRRLIYGLDRMLHVMDLQKGEVQVVPHTGKLQEWSPTWYPGSDRRFYYLIESPDPGWEGYLVLDSFDSPSVVLDDFGIAQSGPSFSAGGDVVGYGVGSNDFGALAVIYREGVGERSLNLASFGISDATRAWSMTFSPDGSKAILHVVVEPDPDDPRANTALLLLDLVENTHEEIARYEPPGRDGPANDLAIWSPDSIWFAYYLETPTDDAGIWRYDLDSQSNIRIGVVLPVTTRVHWLDISPGGEWLVAVVGENDVWFVDTDTWQVTEWRAFENLYGAQWIATP